jgi:hypothetical protein
MWAGRGTLGWAKGLVGGEDESEMAGLASTISEHHP